MRKVITQYHNSSQPPLILRGGENAHASLPRFRRRGVAVLGGGVLTFCFLALATTASADTLIKPTNNLGLVGYWSFDEGTSTKAHDGSGSGNTGTLTNMATPATATSGWTINGKRGNALNFDGTNDYMTVPDTTLLDLTNNFTLSTWIKPTNVTGNKGIISKYNTADGAYQFGLLGNQVFCQFTTGSTWPEYSTSGGTITSGVWSHIACTYDNNTLTIYINGTAVSSTVPGAKTIRNASANLILGNDSTLSSSIFFSGPMDETRIYSRALSAAQVLALYQSGSSKFTTPKAETGAGGLNNGLVGYWTFDGKDTRGTTAYDLSGQNNTGTLTNGPTVAVGEIGQALAFNGTNQRVSTAGNTSADFSTNQNWTFDAWIKPNFSSSSNTGSAIMEVSGPSAAFLRSYLRWESSSLGFYLDTVSSAVGSSWKTAGSATFSANTWHHITFTHTSGNSGQFYWDGVAVSTTVVSSFAVTGVTNLPVDIGWGQANSYFWNGSLDEVRLYNRTLSATEVKELYNFGQAKFATSPVPTDSLASGLVGYWTFDGKDTVWTSATAGTTLDKSGGGNTGTLTNMARSTATTPGKLGQGLNFDGSTNYVVMADASSNDVTTRFGISTWIKPTTLSGDKLILSKFNTANAAYQTFTHGTQFGCQFTTGATWPEFQVLGGTLTAGVWNHVTCSYDNNILAIYVNGVLVNSTTPGAKTVRNSSAHLIIAADDTFNASLYFPGQIDDVRLYNRALSASEVKQLYNLGR